MFTYLMMGLAVWGTNALILLAIRAPYGWGHKVMIPLTLPFYVVLWPMLLVMWGYRAVRVMPEMDVRRIPKEGSDD